MKSQIERYCFREILAKIQSEGKVQLKNKPLNNVMTTTYHPCVVVKLLRAVIVEHLENTRQFLNTQNLKTVNKHSTIHTHINSCHDKDDKLVTLISLPSLLV